jgi:hypothetical protein
MPSEFGSSIPFSGPLPNVKVYFAQSSTHKIIIIIIIIIIWMAYFMLGWPCIWTVWISITMHCLSSVYWVITPMHDSGASAAHHQEVECICVANSTCYVSDLTVNWPGSCHTFSCTNTPTFSTPVILHTYPPMKLEQTGCSETLAFKLQTPVNSPEESIRHSEHGESLKSGIYKVS